MKRSLVSRGGVLKGVLALVSGMALAAQAGIYSCPVDDTLRTTTTANSSPVDAGLKWLLFTAELDARPSEGAISPCAVTGSTRAPLISWTAFFVNPSLSLPSKGFALDITSPVPEPTEVALEVFGCIVLLVLVGGSRPVRPRLQRMRTAIVDWINAV